MLSPLLRGKLSTAGTSPLPSLGRRFPFIRGNFFHTSFSSSRASHSNYRAPVCLDCLDIVNRDEIVVRRDVDWKHYVFGMPMKVKLTVHDAKDRIKIASISEGSSLSDWFLRAFFPRRRPFESHLRLPGSVGASLSFKRGWKFFTSSLQVLEGGAGIPMGAVHQRFSPFRRKFDLESFDSGFFGTIDTPFYKWEYPVRDAYDHVIASVERSLHVRNPFDAMGLTHGEFHIRFLNLDAIQRCIVLGSVLLLEMEGFFMDMLKMSRPRFSHSPFSFPSSSSSSWCGPSLSIGRSWGYGDWDGDEGWWPFGWGGMNRSWSVWPFNSSSYHHHQYAPPVHVSFNSNRFSSPHRNSDREPRHHIVRNSTANSNSSSSSSSFGNWLKSSHSATLDVKNDSFSNHPFSMNLSDDDDDV